MKPPRPWKGTAILRRELKELQAQHSLLSTLMWIALIGYEANVKARVGSNQYAFELIKAIYQADQKNQYLVYLPTPPLPDLPPEGENWHYQVVGPTRLWNLFGLPCGLYSQKPRPDLVFNPGHYSPLFSPAPMVMSIMDLGYLRFPQHFTKPILFKLKFWTALSVKRAAHLFAISEATKNDIIKYYQVEPKRITVTYPGYDKNKFKAQSEKLKVERVKQKYRIQGDYILFLSSLKPNKNVEGLLEAFKIVISDQGSVAGKKKLATNHQSPFTLIIAGKKGWMYEKVFEKVKKLNLQGNVIFTGFVEEKDVPVLMAGAKVFVLPSFWEGFGIPVVEAMASGTPVVVSNAGSLPEIVGEAGIIVNPDDPEDIAQGIRRVIDETSTRKTLIKKGLERVKKFSWEKCALKTTEVFHRVAGK